MNDQNDNPEEDTARPTDQRPLGYWLRVVDGLLTREFATALGDEALTRRDWMLLNVLSSDVEAPELRERLARKGKRLRALEERGWVAQQGDGTWTLTDLGRAEKERIGALVDGIRARVVNAVGPDAYAAMTASLESIARELGWDETSSNRGDLPGFGGFGRGFGFGRPGFGPGPRFGFGPGFGARPHPFDPDVHDGFGRNRHRGFAPGRPGHPAERFDEPFSHHAEDENDGCHGHPHHGYGHGPAGQGHGHGHGNHGHGGHGHGGHGAGDADRHHGDHPKHHHDGRRAQRAYERGFDAGFIRGREAGAA